MNNGNKHVRWATIEDAEDLIRLNNEFNGVFQTLERVKAKLEVSQELVVLAHLHEKIVGFACAQWYSSFCYDNPYGEITEMYVQEHARKNGLATMMISLLEDGLRERGVQSVKLLTGIKNKVAIKFYEHSGYQKEDDLLLTKCFDKEVPLLTNNDNCKQRQSKTSYPFLSKAAAFDMLSAVFIRLLSNDPL